MVFSGSQWSSLATLTFSPSKVFPFLLHHNSLSYFLPPCFFLFCLSLSNRPTILFMSYNSSSAGRYRRRLKVGRLRRREVQEDGMGIACRCSCSYWLHGLSPLHFKISTWCLMLRVCRLHPGEGKLLDAKILRLGVYLIQTLLSTENV